MDLRIKQYLAELVHQSRDMYLGYLTEGGYPAVISVFTIHSPRQAGTYFISTNTSSKHVQCLKNNPKACLYFCDNQKFRGLTLTGTCSVLTDLETKRRFWHEGDEQYYPKGVDDEDYCILHFTAESCRYYLSPGLHEMNASEYKGEFLPSELEV